MIGGGVSQAEAVTINDLDAVVETVK